MINGENSVKFLEEARKDYISASRLAQVKEEGFELSENFQGWFKQYVINHASNIAAQVLIFTEILKALIGSDEKEKRGMINLIFTDDGISKMKLLSKDSHIKGFKCELATDMIPDSGGKFCERLKLSVIMDCLHSDEFPAGFKLITLSQELKKGHSESNNLLRDFYNYIKSLTS